jgi:hypothetical protein
LHLDRSFTAAELGQHVAEKLWMQATQKDLGGEAREELTSGRVLSQYADCPELRRRVRSIASLQRCHMSLFQQPVSLARLLCFEGVAQPAARRSNARTPQNNPNQWNAKGTCFPFAAMSI